MAVITTETAAPSSEEQASHERAQLIAAVLLVLEELKLLREDVKLLQGPEVGRLRHEQDVFRRVLGSAPPVDAPTR